MKHTEVKQEQLYLNPRRIFDELAYLGIDKDAPLIVEDITAFDQYPYQGTEAVDEAIQALGINANTQVLDIGSGIGGPARYLAHKTGCQVTALELQEDLHHVALELTQRCGLSDRIEHICGDILQWHAKEKHFDAIVSWLTFEYIRDRQTLLSKCHQALKSEGQIYVEEFYKRHEFTPYEFSLKAYYEYLPTLDQYKKQWIEAGFTDIQVVDKTKKWSDFVTQRLQKFQQARSRHIAVHSLEVVDGLEQFYLNMHHLLVGGNLGGLQVIARIV